MTNTLGQRDELVMGAIKELAEAGNPRASMTDIEAKVAPVYSPQDVQNALDSLEKAGRIKVGRTGSHMPHRPTNGSAPILMVTAIYDAM